MSADFSHIWLVGDRIACMSCGDLAGDVEFVGPGRPLCGACRGGDPREHDGRLYCAACAPKPAGAREVTP